MTEKFAVRKHYMKERKQVKVNEGMQEVIVVVIILVSLLRVFIML